MSGSVVARMKATSFGSPFGSRAESVLPERKFDDATIPARAEASESTQAILRLEQVVSYKLADDEEQRDEARVASRRRQRVPG